MILRNKHSGYTKDGLRTYNMDGGGSSTPSTQTSVSDLPDWAKGYAQETLAKTQALTSQPYQLYGGERIAGFSPLQQQAQQGIAGMTPSQQVAEASDIASLAGAKAFQAGQYQPGRYTGGTFTPGAAGFYMSPFIEQAMAPQLREAQRSSDILGTQQAGQAVQAGAFGGSRAGLLEAERQRNLATQMGDIRARGYQTAYEQAANQFNQDMQRRMQAQQLGEQSRQFGAGLGLQGLGTALQAAGQLGGLGQTQFGQQKDILGMQSAAGAEQQALRQQGLSQAYQDFIEQQNYPYRQLGFMSDMLRGLPLGQQTSQQIYAAQPPLMSQLAGLGMGAYGLSRLAKKGGGIVGMAEGGYTDISDKVLSDPTKYSEEQIRKSVKNGVLDPETAQIVLAQIARAKKAAAGINMLPSGLPTKEYAPGGIVAFDDGGEVPRFQAGGQPATPFGRWWESTKAGISESMDADALRNELQRKYGPASAGLGLFMRQTPEERKTAQDIIAALPSMSYQQMKALAAQGPSFLPTLMAKTPTDPREEQALRNIPATAQAPVPIAKTPTAVDEYTGSADPFIQDQANPEDIFQRAEAAGARARAGVKDITLPAMTPAAYVEKLGQAMPEGEAAISNPLTPSFKQMQKGQKEAAEAQHKESLNISDRMDKLRAAQEARYKSKEKDIETDRDRTVGIAFLEAAQAMVQPGQTFMQGLARSGAAGGKRYMEDKERLDKRADELSDAVMRLDEARVGDARERAKAKSDLQQALLNADQAMLNHRMTAYGENMATARNALNASIARETGIAQLEAQNQKTRLDAEHNAGQRAIAAAGVGVQLEGVRKEPNELATLRAVMADPKLMEAYRAMHPDKKNVMDHYVEWIKGAGPNIQMLPPEQRVAAFLAEMSVLRGPSNVRSSSSPTGTVVNQPAR